MKAVSKQLGRIDIEERKGGGYTLISESLIMLFPNLDALLAYADISDVLGAKNYGVFVLE